MNRCPTKSVLNKVPEKAWSGKSCDVSHLRIFGCVAYSHVPGKIRRKLDNRSEKCIFIGYSKHYKAYKLYNPITKKLIVSRDVEFKEEEAWDGSIDEKITHGAVLPHVEDDEEVVQGGKKFHNNMFQHTNPRQTHQEGIQHVSIHLKQEYQEISCKKSNLDMEASIHQVHK